MLVICNINTGTTLILKTIINELECYIKVLILELTVEKTSESFSDDKCNS